MSNLQRNTRVLSDDDIKTFATTISTPQIVAYILTNFSGNAASLTLSQKKKDPVIAEATNTALAGLNIVQCMNIWYMAQSFSICPPINTFNGITKLTEKGYDIKMVDNTVTISKDYFSYEATVNNGLVQLAATKELNDELEGKFIVSPHAEGIASLAVVLSSLSSIQNGKVRMLMLDETSFLAAGLGSVFDKPKYDTGLSMIALHLDQLFRLYAPQLLESDVSTKITCYGNVYCSHLYDCLFKSVKQDHVNKVPPQNRWIKNLIDPLNAMTSGGQKVKTLEGKVITQKMAFNTGVLSFIPAPCTFPSSVGQKSLSWDKGSAQSISNAMYILQKCRSVRGADNTEKSALSRMAYLGVLVSPTIAATMYTVTNLSRFISPEVQTFIIYDDGGKAVGPVIHALRTFFPPDRELDLVCHLKSDVKKMLRQEVINDGEPSLYVIGTRIRIKEGSPNVYIANDPVIGDLVYDARIFTSINWESQAKHQDYEKNVKDAHFSRLVEWSKLFKGRPCFGRLPFCNYQRDFFHVTAQNVHHDFNLPGSSAKPAVSDKCANALHDLRTVTTKFLNVPAKNGVVSGVELHNLIGWEFSGIEPAMHFADDEKKKTKWWYNLREWDNMVLAAQICNMSRVQWAFTRRSPCQRLVNKGLKYPVIDRTYIGKVPVVSLLYDLQDIATDEELVEITPEDFEKLCSNLEPEAVAALHVRYNAVRTGDFEVAAAGEGAHPGDDLKLFDDHTVVVEVSGNAAI